MNYGNTETGHRHYGVTVPGGNCEYNAYSIKSVNKIPNRLSFPHASLVDTAGVALHGIKLIGNTPGGPVAVYGPGPIGLCALQIARGLGARNVVMVGRGHRLKVAEEMGADEVLECSGGAETPQQCVDIVRKGGKYLSWVSMRTEKFLFP